MFSQYLALIYYCTSLFAQSNCVDRYMLSLGLGMPNPDLYFLSNDSHTSAEKSDTNLVSLAQQERKKKSFNLIFFQYIV